VTGVDALGLGLATRLRQAGLEPGGVLTLIDAALAEDLAGGGDITTAATIAPGTRAKADVVARENGTAAGMAVAEAVFMMTATSPAGQPAVLVTAHVADGDRVRPGDTLMTVEGELAAILTAERTALNLLCHLSGVASLTRRWVDAVAGTGALIRDTRKTLPGLRALEKYAVRCGGGVNHRMSLADAVLIKDNHVAGAGSVSAAITAATAAASGRGLAIEVECGTVAQVREAIEAGAELILLDNFGLPQTQAAVTLAAGRAKLEASGGLTLPRARDVALTGVDYLAVGALTHSAPALDIGLDLGPGG
jgi:nicotinate-nucleotide pyrophosphorylase (carboxylating)